MKTIYNFISIVVINLLLAHSAFAQPCYQQVNRCEAYQARNATSCPNVASWANEATLAPTYSSGAVDVLGILGSVSPTVSFSGFGFTIPADCTICRVEVSVTRRMTSNGLVVIGPFAYDNSVRVNGGANLAVGGAWPGVATAQVYNAGAAFTPTGINAGLTLSMAVNVGAFARVTGQTTATISSVRATVYVSWTESVVIPCPLPVTLSYFKGEQERGCANLSWRTESEFDNDYFIIEKLVGDSFIVIGRVDSKAREDQGNLYYDFKDCAVTSMNYYRLVQVDINGKREVIGDMASVPFEVPLEDDVVLVPNPASDYVCVGSKTAIREVRLISSDGRLIKMNAINDYTQQNCLDLVDCQKGVYNVVVTTTDGMYSKRLVIE